MAVRTAPPGLQLSWVDGEAVAWQPGRGVYGGNLHHEVARVARRPSMAYNGSTRVMPLQLPDGRVNVMCQRLDAVTLASLGQLDALAAEISPSVAWFGALHRYAEQLVLRGRVLPVVVHISDMWWLAEWHPLTSDVEAARLELLASMPPVVAAAGPVDPVDVLYSMVDRLCRLSLNARGWRAAISDTRAVNGRAVRLVSRALIADTGQFAVAAELGEAVAHIATEFSLITRRAEGEPIVRVRLRLGLPREADELEFDADADANPDAGSAGWPLVVELVDGDDRGRWCTAAQLTEGGPAAMALAHEERFLPLLQRRLSDAMAATATAVPELADWLAHQGTTIDIEVAAAALEGIDALAAAGVELLAPEKLTRRRPSTRATAQPKDAAGSGRFAATALVDWKVVVDGEPVADDVLRRAAEDGANLIQIGGRWVQIDRAEARRALANLQEHRSEHGEMSALALLTLAAELQRELEAAGLTEAEAGTDLVHATGWAGELLEGLPDEALADGEVPPGFTATLRPYQRRGLGWLQFLHRLGLGGCLADDMGLGKTPTTLAHLAGIPGPHLVVCPLSVVRNWESEAARFTPFMRVMVHHGTGRLAEQAFINAVAQHDLVITTYQVAARDLDTFQKVAWSTSVLDEAQAVKNPDTRTARAMRALPAGQRIALTGTPVENRLTELWSIFQVVAPGLLGNATQFRQHFANLIEREHDPVATAELRRLTGPFLLRRTKADKSLVPDLPDKVEQVAWAPLTREQAHMYQAVVDQLLADAQEASGMRRRGLVLAALTRLKQICNHPAHALGDGSKLAGRSGKLTRFDELVTDLLDAGEQALVFTQFREMGLLLQTHLHERFNQTVPFLHGGVTKNGRDHMVQQFQAGTATSPLLLVSLKAGGTGLNLTAASQVVHYDRWWNPAVEDQATDRAWRIGQSRTVFVHKLVSEGTVEEKIDALITDKRGLANAVVGTTGEAWLSELSTDQLRDLVVLDHSRIRGAS
ncbi:MAG: SNF2-related protein [Actinomycetota bacterium]|nr:SNF2-related protein [Actinomycetota bacterium]